MKCILPSHSEDGHYSFDETQKRVYDYPNRTQGADHAPNVAYVCSCQRAGHNYGWHKDEEENYNADYEADWA